MVPININSFEENKSLIFIYLGSEEYLKMRLSADYDFPRAEKALNDIMNFVDSATDDTDYFVESRVEYGVCGNEEYRYRPQR